MSGQIKAGASQSILDVLYQRLTYTRGEEISRLKEERLARQMHERELAIHYLEERRKQVKKRFERFMHACKQESMQNASGMGG